MPAPCAKSLQSVVHLHPGLDQRHDWAVRHPPRLLCVKEKDKRNDGHYHNHHQRRKGKREKERKKRTRNASRMLQKVLSMSSYPSCKLGIGERRHVRYCAFDERESVLQFKKKKQLDPVASARNSIRMEGKVYRSSSWSSSRWRVSAALRCSLSSASSRARAMSSTRAQNASVPSCRFLFICICIVFQK